MAYGVLHYVGREEKGGGNVGADDGVHCPEEHQHFTCKVRHITRFNLRQKPFIGILLG